MSQYLPSNPEALKKIKHIVVLMLENRSFDNLLGWLYDGEEIPNGQEFDGLNYNLWNPLDNIDPNGVPFIEKVSARKNGETYQLGRKKVYDPPVDYTLPKPDPGEGFKDTNFQLYSYYDVASIYPPFATNMGFVNNYKNAMLSGSYVYQDKPSDPRDIMACYTPEQVPALSSLAKNFAVCDQWHCSIPSQTLPNRDFFHAASSCGQVNNDPNGNCDAKTIFNQIQDAIDNDDRTDLSWKVYSGTQDGKQFSLTRTIMTALQSYELNDNFQNISQFYKDAANNQLASYTFLEPQFSGPGQNDQHPPIDVRSGDQLIADVYNAIRKSDAFNETLLIFTYDEHGGCYDHVTPPNEATPPDPANPVGQFGFRFNRLGVRVPAVLVSPYIKAGTIARPAGYAPYEHTSVIKTIQMTFGLEGHLTERDKAAPDLSGVLTLDKPRTNIPDVEEPKGYIPSTTAGAANDLNHISADALAKMTGKPKPKDESKLHDYIHDTYEAHFNGTKGADTKKKA